MNYRQYAAGVERRRAVLKTELHKANRLRREANLPIRDVDQTVAQTEPMLTQHEFDARAREQAGFNKFRRRQLATMELPNPGTATNWQAQRALAFRRMFVEHQIQKDWKSRKPAKLT